MNLYLGSRYSENLIDMAFSRYSTLYNFKKEEYFKIVEDLQEILSRTASKINPPLNNCNSCDKKLTINQISKKPLFIVLKA